MSTKTTKGYISIALAAAIAVPALLAQPAAAAGGGDYGDYHYRKFLATETLQEKTKRNAVLLGQQNVRTGASDSTEETKQLEAQSYRFNFNVPAEEEQHYRD